MLQANNKDTKTMSGYVVLMSLLLILRRFNTKVSRFKFKHAGACGIGNPAGIYLLEVNKRNTRTRCEICSKLTIKIPERRQWRYSGIFIVNLEHISHLVLVFLLLTLGR